jgi:metal-responsive CopG/Arc/MetJ family transcriptional regulator
MESDKRYVNLYLDAATLERIDEYRFENRFPSRTEAIRHLIEKALPPGKKPPSKRT